MSLLRKMKDFKSLIAILTSDNTKKEKSLQTLKSSIMVQELNKKVSLIIGLMLLLFVVDKLFKIPLIISTCLLAFAHGSNEVNVSAPCAAMIFLLNEYTKISNVEAY